MKRHLVLGMILLLLAASAFAGDGSIRRTSPTVPGQYIVVFNDDVRDVDALSDELARSHGAVRQHVYQHAIKGFSMRATESVAAALSRNPRVAWVEEDGEVSLWGTQTPTPSWGLDRIDQRDLPLDNTYNYSQTGAGVKAYIIDTGILLSHNDFGGRAIDGTDTVDGSLPAADCNGHGTHVAGTVGGTTYGVAKGVTLVAVRVLNCSGSGTWSGVIAGVDWVTADHAAGQPAVANMSLGGGANSSVDAAVNNSINDGVTYAIASGNSNADACNYTPARVAAAITVNSSTSTDARSSFSNFGTCTDIFAPGSSITSAWYTSNTATNTISGTSMATPHVAGAAALYLETNPSASPATVAQAITNNATAGKITSPGSGSPNLLLYSLFGGEPPPPPPGGDFSLSISPSSQSVGRNGGTRAYTVTITRTGGFADPVSLSVSGLPAGASGSFSPNPASGSSSTLTVVVSSSTARGSYTFTVSGTGGSLTRTATATLTKNNAKN